MQESAQWVEATLPTHIVYENQKESIQYLAKKISCCNLFCDKQGKALGNQK